MSLALVLAGVLALVNFNLLHFFGNVVCISCSPLRRHLISFGVGIAIIYLLIALLPDIYQKPQIGIAYAVLIGFTLFYLIEKYIYKLVPKRKLKKDLQQLHSLVLFVIGLIEGVLIYHLSVEGVKEALLFFFPILFVSISDDFSLHFVHGKEKRMISQLIVILAPIFGVLLAVYQLVPLFISNYLLGFIGGILLYIVVNELIHREKKGSTPFFMLGLGMYLVVTVIITNFL